MNRSIPSRWETALLVCRKCQKRQKFPLAKLLKRALKGGRKRKARVGVIEVKCLGVCPRHAVTMIDAARPGEWLLIRPEVEIEALVEQLGLGGISRQVESPAGSDNPGDRT